VEEGRQEVRNRWLKPIRVREDRGQTGEGCKGQAENIVAREIARVNSFAWKHLLRAATKVKGDAAIFLRHRALMKEPEWTSPGPKGIIYQMNTPPKG